MKTIIKLISITTISSFFLILSMNVHAKIYKWSDANGQTHYTAYPPTQKNLRLKATNIEDKIKANAGKSRAPQQAKTATSGEIVAAADGKTEEKLSGPNPQLVKYCKSQRNNLDQLQKNFRNVWIDAKGKKTSLNQEQRLEKVSMLKSQIKADCEEVQPSKQS